MIIKVVELLEDDQYTEYSERGGIAKKEKRYGLVENFLNISKIISFREVDPDRYEKENLPEGLSIEQKFTYISLADGKRGVVVIDSPQSLQEKINSILVVSGKTQDLLRG